MNVIPAFLLVLVIVIVLELIPSQAPLIKPSGLIYLHAKPGSLIILAAVMR